MGFQQVFYAERIQCRVKFVGGNGVLHLLNLFDRSHHVFSVDDVANLVLTQFIALDGQRRVNRLDAVRLAQPQSVLLLQTDGIAFNLT